MRTPLPITLLFGLIIFLGGAENAASQQLKTKDEKIQSLQGFWRGSWGGGSNNGVVFQPVIAEFFVEGDQVRLSGFRNIKRQLVAVFRLHSQENRILLKPKNPEDEKPVVFRYELKGDQLRLSSKEFSVSLQRIAGRETNLATIRPTLVPVEGISDRNELLIRQPSVLRSKLTKRKLFQVNIVRRKLGGAKILRAAEKGWEKVEIADARKALEGISTVALIELSARSTARAPEPDSESALKTLHNTVRKGTLVFILKPEQVPPP